MMSTLNCSWKPGLIRFLQSEVPGLASYERECAFAESRRTKELLIVFTCIFIIAYSERGKERHRLWEAETTFHEYKCANFTHTEGRRKLRALLSRSQIFRNRAGLRRRTVLTFCKEVSHYTLSSERISSVCVRSMRPAPPVYLIERRYRVCN